jgi:hypothetical protein
MTKKEHYFEAALEVARKEKLKVSFLVDNPLPKHIGEGKESYVGVIEGIDKKFVYLNVVYTWQLHVFTFWQRNSALKSTAIIEKCKNEGLDVPNHMSTISAGLAATIREWFTEGENITTVESAEKVDLEKVLLYEESRILCQTYGLNPFGVIASGALLVDRCSIRLPWTSKVFQKSLHSHSSDRSGEKRNGQSIKARWKRTR